MAQNFLPGDFLIFQIESAYALLRVLAIDGDGDDTVWHLRAYADYFPDIDSAEAASNDPASLKVEISHAALTDRAFEGTQVAKLSHIDLNSEESESYGQWVNNGSVVSDRTIRLLLGIR